MPTTRRFILYDRNGHVIADSATNATFQVTWNAETPREKAAAHLAAAERWSAYVDLMLKGKRETGSGKVVPA